MERGSGTIGELRRRRIIAMAMGMGAGSRCKWSFDEDWCSLVMVIGDW
jgi:hypothetical protein